MNFADLRADADKAHQQAWDEVQALTEQVEQLKSENARLKELLATQGENARRHIALRDQLVDKAAAELDAADKREAGKDARIEQLIAELSRFRALSAMLREAEYGARPFDNERVEARRPLALGMN